VRNRENRRQRQSRENGPEDGRKIGASLVCWDSIRRPVEFVGGELYVGREISI
jgi:hypothetical protein